jgi:hypothetical protein
MALHEGEGKMSARQNHPSIKKYCMLHSNLIHDRRINHEEVGEQK